jgi:hypothetical protein
MLCPVIRGSYTSKDMVWWNTIIQDYTKNIQVFACPQDKDWQDHFAWDAGNKVTTSYGINRFAFVNTIMNGPERVYEPGKGWIRVRGAMGKLSAMPDPARLVLIADSGWGSFVESVGMADGGWHPWYHFPETDPQDPDPGKWLHVAHPPVGFADGHVKILRVRTWAGVEVAKDIAYTWKAEWGTE